MYKKLVIIIFILISLVGCCDTMEGFDSNGTLVVNDQVIADADGVVISREKRTAIVPVLRTLSELGAEIMFSANREQVLVTFNSFTYTFDLLDANLGLPIPSWAENLNNQQTWKSRFVRKVSDEEIFIDCRFDMCNGIGFNTNVVA